MVFSFGRRVSLRSSRFNIISGVFWPPRYARHSISQRDTLSSISFLPSGENEASFPHWAANKAAGPPLIDIVHKRLTLPGATSLVEEYNMLFPSRVHPRAVAALGCHVCRLASPPLTDTVNTAFPPERFDVNAINFPSGEK